MRSMPTLVPRRAHGIITIGALGVPKAADQLRLSTAGFSTGQRMHITGRTLLAKEGNVVALEKAKAKVEKAAEAQVVLGACVPQSAVRGVMRRTVQSDLRATELEVAEKALKHAQAKTSR